MAATFEQAKDQVAGLVAHFRANSDRELYQRQIDATDRAKESGVRGQGSGIGE